MKYNIKPLGNRAVIKLVKKQQTSASGIILSAKAENEQAIGEILAIGLGMGEKDNILSLGLKIGDKVLVSKYAGNEIKDNEDADSQYKIIDSKDILAIVEMQ